MAGFPEQIESEQTKILFHKLLISTTLTRSKKKEASLLPTQWCIHFTTEVIETYMWSLEYQQNSYLLQPIEEKAERGSVDRGFFFFFKILVWKFKEDYLIKLSGPWRGSKY